MIVVDVQRAGPSTGMPTKTEQADLRMMIGAGHGDFPRIVLAPSTLEECYTMVVEAFHLADKYQCPVLLQSDLYLSERNETIDGLDINNVRIEQFPDTIIATLFRFGPFDLLQFSSAEKKDVDIKKLFQS